MIFNIYKPVDWTSFDVVKKIRGITHEKKVGHAGTLDPFAEGVLVIGTGKDTKSLSSISSTNKSYTATLQLGVETDTLDTEGKNIKKKDIPKLDIELIKDALSNFIGIQTQIPPMYSAKKVGGKKLYDLARQNIEIERDPIEITIQNIDLIDFTKDTINFTVTCSKGTYVRVLGADIAKTLGTVGHLIKLVRNSVGNYQINDSLKIEDFEKQWKNILV